MADFNKENVKKAFQACRPFTPTSPALLAVLNTDENSALELLLEFAAEMVAPPAEPVKIDRRRRGQRTPKVATAGVGLAGVGAEATK